MNNGLSEKRQSETETVALLRRIYSRCSRISGVSIGSVYIGIFLMYRIQAIALAGSTTHTREKPIS